MPGSHGWAEIARERKLEIIQAIEQGTATRGPVHAELDLTDRCNVACYFCNQQDVRTAEQIPLDRAVSLINELAEGGLKSVRLSGGGDPLFHREILAVLDHLRSRGIVVDNLTTNGLALTSEVAARLVEGRCREVVFSLNAVDAEDYHRMMQVRPVIFDRVLANIRGLAVARGDTGYPTIVIQFLLDRENFSTLPRMYELGRSLGADRIAVGLVLNIPLRRIDPSILLGPADGDALRPYLRQILERDRDAGLLQLDFPVPAWNTMVSEIRRELGAAPPVLLPTAGSFQAKNGGCFFGWYTATVRGNGELYPCCLLMTPDYKPLGNAVKASFQQQWQGPGFSRLRTEMRDVLLTGGRILYRKERFQTLGRQCVEPDLCWLKNVYFRGDEEFYGDLNKALERARKKEVRWFGGREQRARAVEVLSYRLYHGARVRAHHLLAALHGRIHGLDGRITRWMRFLMEVSSYKVREGR